MTKAEEEAEEWLCDLETVCDPIAVKRIFVRALDAARYDAKLSAIRDLATALKKWCPEAIDAVQSKIIADEVALNEFMQVLRS